jgi:hypothetical protein
MPSSLTSGRARRSDRAKRASVHSSLKWLALFAAVLVSGSIWMMIFIAIDR